MAPKLLRVAALAAWLGLMTDLLILSPPEHPKLGAYIVELATFRGNPLEVMVFQLMGLWPITYLRLLAHERGRPPAWPFLVASFAAGAFALLPYVALHPRPPLAGTSTRIQRSRWSLGALAAAFAGLVIYGLGWGSLENYREGLASIRFLQVMTFDCIALTLFYGPVWRSRRA